MLDQSVIVLCIGRHVRLRCIKYAYHIRCTYEFFYGRSKTYVCLRGLTYIHRCRSYVHIAARFHERRISSVTFMSAHLYGRPTGYMLVGVTRALADSSSFGLFGFWGSNVRKNL